MREKVRPARLDVGVSAKKFALHAQNGRKTLFSGALGEFFRGDAAIGPCWASYFAEKSLEGLCWANFVARADRDGAWRVQLEPEYPGQRLLSETGGPVAHLSAVLIETGAPAASGQWQFSWPLRRAVVMAVSNF